MHRNHPQCPSIPIHPHLSLFIPHHTHHPHHTHRRYNPLSGDVDENFKYIDWVGNTLAPSLGLGTVVGGEGGGSSTTSGNGNGNSTSGNGTGGNGTGGIPLIMCNGAATGDTGAVETCNSCDCEGWIQSDHWNTSVSKAKMRLHGKQDDKPAMWTENWMGCVLTVFVFVYVSMNT